LPSAARAGHEHTHRATLVTAFAEFQQVMLRMPRAKGRPAVNRRRVRYPLCRRTWCRCVALPEASSGELFGGAGRAARPSFWPRKAPSWGEFGESRPFRRFQAATGQPTGPCLCAAAQCRGGCPPPLCARKVGAPRVAIETPELGDTRACRPAIGKRPLCAG